MVVDYSKAKIYAIRSRNSDDVYIGSTCQPLYKRFSGHKSMYDRGYICQTKSRDIFKHGDTYIELIEEFPCGSKNELIVREMQIIRSTPCVNVELKVRKRLPWQEQPSVVEGRKNILCECGITVQKRQMMYHKMSERHAVRMTY